MVLTMKLQLCYIICCAIFAILSSANQHGRRAPNCRLVAPNALTTTTSSTTSITTLTATTASTSPSSLTSTTTTSTPALSTFIIEGSGSGTAADGAYLKGTQQDSQLLIFNPFEPGPTTQIFSFDSTTGFIYDGTFQLCSTDSAANDPSAIVTCAAGTAQDATSGRTPLICSMFNGTLTHCSITARGGRGVYNTLQLFSEYGQQELAIGSTLDSRYLPVTLDVVRPNPCVFRCGNE